MLIAAQAICPDEAFDVAVIGAGVVGVFVAVQLERTGLQVALIEGDGKVPGTQGNADHTRIAGRLHSSVEAGRAMGLGGTGLLWGGQLSEFGAADLRGGFWPVDLAALRELYDRVYAALGLPPRLSNGKARVRFGGDEGVIAGVERIFSYWLPNPNLAGLYRKVLTASERISVVTDAKATGFEFREDSGADAVRLRCSEGDLTLRARHFVIAGGVVESIRLALAAKADPHCGWRTNQRVGAAFQDHLGGSFGALSVRDEKLFRERFETGFFAKTKYMPKLRYAAAPNAAQPLSISAFPVFHSNLGEAIANVKMLAKAMRSGSSFGQLRELPGNLLRIGRAFIPLVRRYVRDRRVMALMDRGATLGFQCEQRARIDSRIVLDGSEAASDGLPPVRIEWRADAETAAFLREAAGHFARYFAETGVADLALDPAFAQDDTTADNTAIMAMLTDTSHPCGGLCMGSNSNEGATDPDGRMWGSPNVHVAGAAALATSGEANITLTALAMALRLCDRLRTEMRG